MTPEERRYLDGWSRVGRVVELYVILGQRSESRRQMRRRIWRAGELLGCDYDPFTPFGAGQADAALAAFGLDA